MKKITKILSIAALGMALTGCGGGNSTASSETDGLSGRLVIYNTAPEWLAEKVVVAFNEKHPGLTIHYAKEGTDTIVNRLLLENEQEMISGDLVWVADPASLEDLVQNDILEKYESEETMAIADEYKDPEGRWYGNRVLRMALAYNTNIENTPTKWADLIAEENRGDAALPGVRGGSIYTWAATMVYNEDQFGWNYMKEFKENDGYLVRNLSALGSMISTGEVKMGVVTDYIVRDLKAQGSPIDYVYPEEGVVEFATPIALLEGAKNPEAAKAFLDFTLSEEGQEIFARNNQAPVRNLDLDLDFLNAEFNVLTAPAEFLEENQVAVRRELAKVFGAM